MATAPPFQFAAKYIDIKQPSGFSFVGQQTFAAMQQQLASHESTIATLQNNIATLQAQVKALQL
jgi:cell division protein FtsB